MPEAHGSRNHHERMTGNGIELNDDGSRETCWVISDGAAGNERQALALAQGLGLEAVTIRLRLARPWRWFAPLLTWRGGSAMRCTDGLRISTAWPDAAID